MTTIRTLIVDDEPLARRGIRLFLAGHSDVDVAGEARNGREAVRLLRALSPDLVFLDVQMPELDGFAVLRALAGQQLPLVIFVTAYDSFAVRAFDAHAVDYLVKPVQEARFHEALGRARERLRSREAVDLSRRLSQLLNDPAALVARTEASAARRLVIGTAGADLIVDIAAVDWIEADDYYAAVHFEGRRHLVRESLSSLERRLEDAHFIRVHRSAIVNLARVVQIRSGAGGDAAVVLVDGTEVPLGRRRREQVAAAIRRFADPRRGG
jgi:two-component system, LytTR family, response regulator